MVADGTISEFDERLAFMEREDEDQTDETSRPSCWRRTRRWRRLAMFLLLLLVGTFAAAVLNNNVSFSSPTAADLRSQLDAGLEAGMQWIEPQKISLSGSSANEALIYMVRRMNEQTPHPDWQAMVDTYGHTHTNTRYVWRRLAHPQAEVERVNRSEVREKSDYQRWIAFGLAADEVPLSEEDLASMLSPDRHSRGSLTHQLFALMIVREQGRSDLDEQDLDQLMNTLCERIASEAVWDFRVTDLYLQRVAFLLAAGRPDLVEPRWIERILANQQADGGFLKSWYGWGPGVLQRSPSKEPTPHATVQGVWLMYMLKHQYPDWPSSAAE